MRRIRKTGGHCLITNKNVLLFGVRGGGREMRTVGGRQGIIIATAITISIKTITTDRSGRVGEKFEVELAAPLEGDASTTAGI